MSKENIESIKKKVKSLSFDIRFEVLIAELLANSKITAEEFIVQPLGVFKRGYRRDIEEIDTETNSFNDNKVFFKISREGLFDTLPEGLFFNNRKSSDSSDKKDNNQEEIAARVFFSPFEQMFYEQRILIEQQERDLINGYSSSIGKELFSDFWNLSALDVSKEYHSLLLYLLPLVYQYKGDLDNLETIYSAALQVPIKFEKVWNKVYSIPAELQTEVGEEIYLGSTSVLGNQFQDGIPTLKIKVGPISQDDEKDYLVNQDKYRLIQVLNQFFLPIEATIEEVEIITIVQQTASSSARLGTTYVTEKELI